MNFGETLREYLSHQILRFISRAISHKDIRVVRRRTSTLGGRSAASVLKRYPHLNWEKVSIGHIGIERVIHPKSRGVLVWCHGGGYCFGSISEYRGFAGRLAARLELDVVLFEYRLAPECPYPAALDDAALVYDWAKSKVKAGGHVFLGGDSAGGGIAAALLQDPKHRPQGSILLSPWLDLTMSGASVKSNAHTEYMLNAAGAAECAKYYAGSEPLASPRISPLFGKYLDASPVLLIAGSAEILLDDSREFAKRLREQNVTVELVVEERMQHVFPLSMPHLPQAAKALRKMREFVDKAAVN